jgi:hypothetical protein
VARTRTASGGPGRAGAASVKAGSGGGTVLRYQNRQISSYRGTSVDEFGDLSDVGSPLYTNLPAAIAEVDEVVFDAATQRPQTIRSVKAIVPGWCDIQASDTLQDSFTGWFYIVTSLEAEPGIGYYPARKLLTLKERSGVSVASD